MYLTERCVLKVQYLGAVGGKDVADTTRRILRSLMTNAVAGRMNYAGRGHKRAICELKILDVVIGEELLHFAKALVTLHCYISSIMPTAQPLISNLAFCSMLEQGMKCDTKITFSFH